MSGTPKEKFLDIVTAEQLHVIYDAIQKGYRDTANQYDGFDLSHDNTWTSYGHVRLSFIRQHLEDAQIPNGMEIYVRKHDINGFPQIEIVIDNKVSLTIKSNDDPHTLPESSDIRRKRAKVNKSPQLTLDLDLPNLIEPHTNPEDLEISGIVTFTKGLCREPEFISIVFPSRNYTRTLCDSIDVLKIGADYEASQKAKADERLLKQRPKPINPEKKNVRLKKKA